jgi:L-seryl-tRNA(Ser) seleniumtransferase
VDRVLRDPALQTLLQQYRREPVVSVIRTTLADARRAIAAGESVPGPDVIARRVADWIYWEWRESPTPVINATGVILHTNVGRAPLSGAAVRALSHAAAYGDLEIDLPSGERSDRQSSLASMLAAATGAEDALVVGNNAAAMLLTLAVFAAGREVIVSRGQAVEIGGSFRVPDILRESGAQLVEVGTTNRTRLSDYADAIGPNTAAILHVHSSNFRVVGYTEAVPLHDLAVLAHDRGVVLLDDNGSGALLDTARFGLDHEPMPQESLAAGSDIVTFSGDKLLGGPQSGIVVGRAEHVRALKRSPLARALRPGKLTLAALRATVRAYLDGSAVDSLPVWQMIAQSAEFIESRSDTWRVRAAEHGVPVELRPGQSAVGGGSLPESTLPSTHLLLPASASARALRSNSPAVLPLERDGRVLLDLRTVFPEQEDSLLQAVVATSA